MKEETINIKAEDEKLIGQYSNIIQIIHQEEEFVLDFLNVFSPTGYLTSRIIVAPSHFKRMVLALKDNLEKYEKKFGKIKETDEPGNSNK